jgi:menaquinol-cytochrome c reductase iron-sulfur subunit
MSDSPQKSPCENPETTGGCGCQGASKSNRRDFLLKLGLGLNVVAGAMISVPILGYALSSFFKKMPLKEISLGPIDKFPEGTTRLASFSNPYQVPWDGETAEIPCWVRRIQGEEFQIFAINCTHLGCPVRWFEESKLFMCPCHGGAFYEDGSHASGPPPRGLYTYEYKVVNNELILQGGILPTLARPNI